MKLENHGYLVREITVVWCCRQLSSRVEKHRGLGLQKQPRMSGSLACDLALASLGRSQKSRLLTLYHSKMAQVSWNFEWKGTAEGELSLVKLAH